ncbi:MAG: hypothetical protein WCH20_15905 [Nitrospira sp.]
MTSWLGWFQMVGLSIVAVISTVAVLSIAMRPARWADRKPAQL